MTTTPSEPRDGGPWNPWDVATLAGPDGDFLRACAALDRPEILPDPPAAPAG